MTKIGFTGTRKGMSQNQFNQLMRLVEDIDVLPEFNEVHHGMCIGSDQDFHNFFKGFKEVYDDLKIVGHPGYGKYDGDKRPNRANVITDITREELPYFERNRNIVDECDILLACPYDNIQKGGTWYTINYAKKAGKKVIIFER